jgi:murein DD-endopeptidase MepM/ murein hydrolase activator NlpD
VVTAGWNAGGYGNYVVIDHGNGYKTLYAHMLNNSIVVISWTSGKTGAKNRSDGFNWSFDRNSFAF